MTFRIETVEGPAYTLIRAKPRRKLNGITLMAVVYYDDDGAVWNIQRMEIPLDHAKKYFWKKR